MLSVVEMLRDPIMPGMTHRRPHLPTFLWGLFANCCLLQALMGKRWEHHAEEAREREVLEEQLAAAH